MSIEDSDGSLLSILEELAKCNHQAGIEIVANEGEGCRMLLWSGPKEGDGQCYANSFSPQKDDFLRQILAQAQTLESCATGRISEMIKQHAAKGTTTDDRVPP